MPPAPGWVITDLHVAPRDLNSLRAVGARLAGNCDSVLVGDHAGARNDFSPSFMAAELVRLGLKPWITLSCRDRNRTALGAELAALAELGVAGVHCVTGDWQSVAGAGPEARVFDLDSLRLVEMARVAGLTVSVAATPAAPPTQHRPLRLADKASAGAQVCFINHCGGPVPVGRFVAEARDQGAELTFVPCVPVAMDPASLAALAALPGTAMEPGVAQEVAYADRAAALATAAAAAEAMLAVAGVGGINLSGSASARSIGDSAAVMAALGQRLLSLRSAGPLTRAAQ